MTAVSPQTLERQGVNPLYTLTALGNGGVPVGITGTYAVSG